MPKVLLAWVRRSNPPESRLSASKSLLKPRLNRGEFSWLNWGQCIAAEQGFNPGLVGIKLNRASFDKRLTKANQGKTKTG